MESILRGKFLLALLKVSKNNKKASDFISTVFASEIVEHPSFTYAHVNKQGRFELLFISDNKFEDEFSYTVLIWCTEDYYKIVDKHCNLEKNILN